MPKYTARHPIDEGLEDFPFYPCFGYDAEGRDIGCGVDVDTDTGLVRRVMYDAEGNQILDGYGHPEIPWAKEGERPLETVQFTPPITLERERRTS